jgi:hypothetical protein
MGNAVGKIYVERYFTPEAKKRMDELVSNLIIAMGQRIDGLSWMSTETKKAAHEKLSKFTVKIGYPEKWRDYTALQVAKDDLVGNIFRARSYEYDYQLAKLSKPVDRKEWFMSPQTVNAYYNPSMNEIVFPAAILQPPFFDPNADDAVNYGGIGAVIGHEIGHGFDDQGRKSDGDGVLRDWWTAEDAARFKERADALVARYGEFVPLPGMNVNGQNTLGENIGDLGGLEIAHHAYLLSQVSRGDADQPGRVERAQPPGVPCHGSGPEHGRLVRRVWCEARRQGLYRARETNSHLVAAKGHSEEMGPDALTPRGLRPRGPRLGATHFLADDYFPRSNQYIRSALLASPFSDCSVQRLPSE